MLSSELSSNDREDTLTETIVLMTTPTNACKYASNHAAS